jgi:hypothetical protein
MIHRLARFDFDHGLEFPATIGGQKHEIRKQMGRTGANRHVLLGARVHTGVVLTTEFGMEQADQAVVLQLLANWPNQNRAQRAPPSDWIAVTIKPEILA